MRLSEDRINYVNVGLMLLSCLAAYVFPFELFLFSYAVLGPLHYLTEISWLHDRNYFIEARRGRRGGRAKRAWLVLVMLTLALMLYGLAAEKLLRQPTTPVWEITLFYLVFVTASLLTLAGSATQGLIFVALTLISLITFSGSRYYALVAFFLITIIHVFVFTAAFILFGALKSRSRSGLLSLAVFGLCVVSFFVYAPAALGPAAGGYVRESYGPFQTLNAELIKLFRVGAGLSLGEIYESSAGLAVMRLIAFAYTYHYLNWFSKTSVIKWHEVSKGRAAVIVGVWLISLAVYAYNYQAGIVMLYALSVLHVMLEFPLNNHTFAGIGRELYAISR